MVDALPRWTALLALLASGGCMDADAPERAEASPDDPAATRAACTTTTDPTVYSPYRDPGVYAIGTVADHPWRGVNDGTTGTYPDGDEDFSAYTPPESVECGSTKGLRTYLDVTAGCLSAAQVGTYVRGQIHPTTTGYFRAVALGHDAGDTLPVKWTDQSVEYRFYYSAQTGLVGNPGFKAFARYRDEDDLYVASWRTDGVVQIQRKQCGIYSYLQIRRDLPAPTTRAWHTIRFDAIGDQLTLTLDHQQVMTVTDATFAWGTTGIRIDSMAGAYLDDWRVF